MADRKDTPALISLRIFHQALTNPRIATLQQRIHRLVKTINMVRQKHPVKTYDDGSIESIAKTDPGVVERTLKEMCFTVANSDSKHRRIYTYTKDALLSSLTSKQAEDAIFAAVIERIARMTVILDKIERRLFDDFNSLTPEQVEEKLGGNYQKYLKEYRGFITAFSDMRWAGDSIQKTKKVETVREISREEVSE